MLAYRDHPRSADHLGDTISFKLLASGIAGNLKIPKSYRKRRIFDSRPPRRRIIESSESVFVSRHEFPREKRGGTLMVSKPFDDRRGEGAGGGGTRKRGKGI